MKNNNFITQLYFLVALLLLATMFACSDDEPQQVPVDVGILSASKDEVILDYDAPTEEVITFSWHAEKSSLIQYQLVFSANGKIDTVNVLSEVNKKFIHAELNRILVDDLGLEIGKQANVDVFVYAKGTLRTNTGSSNVVTIAVTPSPKVPEPPLDQVTLSVPRTDVAVDLANPSGEAVTLSWGSERNVFIYYTITLMAGSRTAAVDVLANVSKEFTYVELNNILIDKLKMEVGKAAEVTAQITASVIISDKVVKSNQVVFTATPKAKDVTPPAYTKLWIVGNATPNGWDIGNPNEMVADPANIYQFKFNEVLAAGQFKIPTTTGNWGADTYMPPVDGAGISSTEVKLMPKATPDNKWNIVNAGAYKVLLNISASPFIHITPFTAYDQLYILGDATAAGWDANNAIAMEVDPSDHHVFTWTGELSSTGRGQFTFPVATDASNTTFFAAPTSGADLTATQLSFTSTGTSVNNFKVKEGEDGIYTITINQLKETISIVKQ